MGFGRAIVGALIGAGVGGAGNLFLDGDIWVDNDNLDALANMVKGNSTAFDGAIKFFPDPAAGTALTLPTDGNILDVTGGKLHFAEDYLGKLNSTATGILNGNKDVADYFLKSESTMGDLIAELKEQAGKLSGTAKTAADEVITRLETISPDVGKAIGESQFENDIFVSKAIPIGAGAAVGGTIGAVTGNGDRKVVGKYTGAEAARMSGRSAGGQGMPSDLAAQSGGAVGPQTAKFLEAAARQQQGGMSGPAGA